MDRDTKVWYAIKSIRKSKVGKIEVLKREIALLKEVDHPNIIKLIEAHEDQKYLHLITELCTGGELFDRIIAKTQSDEGHFSEADAAKIVRCILDAIRYCHDVKGIVHRDLKPENFLFSTPDEDAVIKIIDFGLSRHDDMKMGVMNTKVRRTLVAYLPFYIMNEHQRVVAFRTCSSVFRWGLPIMLRQKC
jgi:calcium-dependent protein kinase